jgi:predicted Zn finger-like uncharacterized protein
MILTCPECATSYFVDEDRIPSGGRKVRCSSCGHRWNALPETASAAAEPPASPEPVAPAEPTGEPALETAASAEAEAEADPAAPADDVEFVPLNPVEGRPRPRPPARRTPLRTEPRSSAMVWAGAAALAAALIAGAIVFRENVVQLWPSSGAAYAGLGLAVDGGGLVLEQVHVRPAFVGGRPVLSVTGAIRNLRDAPAEAPPVRVTLLNRAGKPVAAKIARPMDATVPARATRHFAIAILDPPAAAHDLEVRFERPDSGRSRPRAAEAVLAPAPPAAVPAPAAPPAGAPPLSPAAATEHG